MVKFDILYYELKLNNISIDSFTILIKYFLWDILFFINNT